MELLRLEESGIRVAEYIPTCRAVPNWRPSCTAPSAWRGQVAACERDLDREA
ncbi:MAG TPA: hypothetical protein VFX98_03400 [Longimicrobiaceae bacterium]|nr:hypothetical protein [Longimicrobiaceae bacterium]